MRSFTVIQGGRSASASRAVAPADDAGRTVPEPRADAGLRVDLHRTGTVDDEAVAAWRALMTRNAVADPWVDPDYVLSAARHQARGVRVAFAMAWDREGGGAEVLRGVVPLAMPDPIWGRGRARPWRPPGLPHPAAALIDGLRGEAVEAAIRTRLASLPRPIRLDDVPVRLPPPREAPRPVLAASRAGGRTRTIPSDCLVGVRLPGYEAAREVEQVCDAARIAGAVEEFLALDARHASRPIIADPSEASMVRVVTRLFARRGQMRIELARRAGALVAGTLHLGAGARAVVWRHAARA